MKIIIKKILKSRINRDDDIKNNNIVLSKRSYKHLDFLINKMFKKFLILSIYSNYEKFKNFEINLFENQIIDQQDLISILSILVPGKLFEYSIFKIIGKEEDNEDDEEEDEEDEEDDDQIISNLFIKNKIIQQNYIGQFKFTKCFIRALRLILNLIINELIDCCLHHIYSINKRKNIIDLVDLLNTIDKDDDFRILFKKLTIGEFEDNSDKSFVKLYPKTHSNTWNKEQLYNHFNNEAKKVQQYRLNKPLSIYSKKLNNDKGLEIIKKSVILEHVKVIKNNKSNSNYSIVKTISKRKLKKLNDQPKDDDDDDDDDDNSNSNSTQFIGLQEEERTLKHLESLRLDDLKQYSRGLNLKVSGKKSELAQRIIQHYENESKSGKRLLSKNIVYCIKKVSKKGEESIHTAFKSVEIQVFIDTYKVVDPTDPNSIYFEFEDFNGIIGKSDDDICKEEQEEDGDDNSFIYGEYTDDEDDIASEIDGGNELDIYSFDYNQFYKDQLVLLKKSNPTLYSRLLKKSPRYLWKNKDQLIKDNFNIKQYELPPLPESDSEQEENDNEEDDDDNDYDDESESEEISDSAELYDYEACYYDLMGTDSGHDIDDAGLSPYSFFKKRVKNGYDDPSMWEAYRYN